MCNWVWKGYELVLVTYFLYPLLISVDAILAVSELQADLYFPENSIPSSLYSDFTLNNLKFAYCFNIQLLCSHICNSVYTWNIYTIHLNLFFSLKYEILQLWYTWNFYIVSLTDCDIQKLIQKFNVSIWIWYILLYAKILYIINY